MTLRGIEFYPENVDTRHSFFKAYDAIKKADKIQSAEFANLLAVCVDDIFGAGASAAVMGEAVNAITRIKNLIDFMLEAAPHFKAASNRAIEKYTIDKGEVMM